MMSKGRRDQAQVINWSDQQWYFLSFYSYVYGCMCVYTYTIYMHVLYVYWLLISIWAYIQTNERGAMQTRLVYYACI